VKAVFTKPFVRDYRKLPKSIQKRFDRKLALLLKNPHNPSIRARLVDRKKRIWKGNVDGGYRFTFQIEKDHVILRRIGSHERMLRRTRW